MAEYTPEGLGQNAGAMTAAQLAAAAAQGVVLEAPALRFDKEDGFTFSLAGRAARIPRGECALGESEGAVRDAALLVRVGRPTCFTILDVPQNGGGGYLLSRRAAQEACTREYLDALVPGDVIPCLVTRLEPYGAFCDIGCGVCGLLPIDCMSVSRIRSPADRVRAGQKLLCAVKSRDSQGRFVLTLRELMGTWAENAARFAPGQTVVGVVRSVESYGVFIELAPNFAGLAERREDLEPGQPVSVYIKSILPEKMKVKLAVVQPRLAIPVFLGPRYFITGGHIDQWVYSTPGCKKQVETVFSAPAL